MTERVARTGSVFLEGAATDVALERYRAPVHSVDDVTFQFDVDGQFQDAVSIAVNDAIVERHGGTDSVASEPAVGSTFSYTLPVAEETDG